MVAAVAAEFCAASASAACPDCCLGIAEALGLIAVLLFELRAGMSEGSGTEAKLFSSGNMPTSLSSWDVLRGRAHTQEVAAKLNPPTRECSGQ